MPTLDDFTIAWICVAPVELDAARAVLDEEYETPPILSRGKDWYLLGRIAQHRVVIATLPSGRRGSLAAASVASRTLRTFKNIRFALLVGIGGGVPGGADDIRLGDIVVSSPGPGHPGVIQYDYGKKFAAGPSLPVGHLDGSPPPLLAALETLRAHNGPKGPRIPEGAIARLSKHGDRDEWIYPGVEHDRLYMATYQHGVTDDCSHCDDDFLVLRPPRSSTAPHVHYGLIASGNQVIKDGKTRDDLSQKLGILCFEMEAAGLMDDFPGIVIKGIADYADSHKNRRWQRYAAGVAAVYAKELLHYVDALDI